MKGITLCADCAYYSMKKHRCTRGATKDPDPSASFYADCPLDEVEPVRTGRWEANDNYDASVCSVCQTMWNNLDNDTHRFNYCPHCGAKMDGDSHE